MALLSTYRSCPARRRRGFTLIEIMVVVVIIMVLVGLAAPGMRSTIQSTRMKTAARELVGTLRLARNYAIISEHPVSIEFDLEKYRYHAYVLDHLGNKLEIRKRNYKSSAEDRLPPLSRRLSSWQELPYKVYISAVYTSAPLTEDTDLAQVIFYADGSASPTTIALEDFTDKPRTMSIEVYRSTGMARVEKGLPPVENKREKKLFYGRRD